MNIKFLSKCAVILALAGSMAACHNMSTRDQATIGGAALGGAAGGAAGGGWGAAAGAAAGGVLGNQIAR